MRLLNFVLLASLCVLCSAQQFLSVQGGRLMLNGKSVFLSGVNQPWINYGSDFGNADAAHGNGYGSTCALNSYLVNVSSAGGNSIRMWLFVEGASIPSFDQNGNVNGTDSTGSLIADLKRYLEAAEAQNMLVWFCLWNGAHLQNNNAKNLFADAGKLQTFVDKVLTPMVRALAPYRSLGGYEIINEPEGSVSIGSDSNPCFDTSVLSGSGAGWSGANIAMRDLQRFVNVQADAIHAADPKALVTVGSWSEHGVTDNFGYRNYWKDTCLQQAGGKQNGVLDLYQVHSYTYNNQYGPNAPFHHNASDFGLNKPIILGEFATYGSGSSSAQQYQYIHSHGYVGAWGWDAIGGTNVDNLPTLIGGMNAVRGQPDVPINIKGATPGPDCSCSDTAPPPAQYSCAQQASWGKCGETWMAGFCCRSCKGCQGCK